MDRRIIIAVVAILLVAGAAGVYYYYGYEKPKIQNKTNATSNATPNATQNLTKEELEQAKQVPIEGGNEKTIQNTVKGGTAKDVIILVKGDESSRAVIAAMKVAGAIGAATRGEVKAKSALTSEISLSEGTVTHPIIFIKGPKSGATQTKITIVAPGQIVVEGKTYEELENAAIRAALAILGQ